MISIDIDLFRKRLKDRCENKGLSYPELAMAAGVSLSTIEKWLYGKKDDITDSKKPYIPSLDTVYKVALALDCSIDYFVNPNMDCLTVSNQKIHDTIGLSDSAIDSLEKDMKNSYGVIDCLNLFLSHSDSETVIKMLRDMWLYMLNNKRSFMSLDGKFNDDYLILNTTCEDTNKPAVKGHGIGINANNLDGVFLSNITAYLAVLKSKL